MCLEQSEFREQFSYQAPILPDSLDSATAFFYLVNQLIRSTPSAPFASLASSKQGSAGPLLDHLNVRIRGIVLWAVGRIRSVSFPAASIWKK
jgi:hypothetical protein